MKHSERENQLQLQCQQLEEQLAVKDQLYIELEQKYHELSENLVNLDQKYNDNQNNKEYQN